MDAWKLSRSKKWEMYLMLIEIQAQPLVHLSENTQAESISLEAARAREGSKCLALFPALLVTSCVNLASVFSSVKWKYIWQRLKEMAKEM